MSLPPEVRKSAAQERAKARTHEGLGKKTLSLEEVRKNQNRAELKRLNDIAMAVTREAKIKSPSVPINLVTVNNKFSSIGLRSKIPMSGRRKDVHGIKDDGFIKTTKPTPTKGVLGRVATSLRGPAPNTVPDHAKKDQVVRGEIDNSVETKGWSLLFVVHDRARNIGAFLSEGGRIGIYDIAGPLSRMDPEKDPSLSNDGSNPWVLPLDTAAYTSQVPDSERGITYLDTLDGEIPDVINNIVTYGRGGASSSGLRAIELSLYEFITTNDLDK